jgi:5-methyltetrahydropteroyltriglutamate--homocysteine methyltransferase
MTNIQFTISGIYPKLINSPTVPHLKRSLHSFDEGKITADELEQVFVKNTEQIIKEQREAGITIFSDSMIRWEDFYSPFAKSWRNIERDRLKRTFDTNTLHRRPKIVGPLLHQSSKATSDASFAQGLLQGDEYLKATLPGPISFALDSDDEYYPDFQARTLAIAKCLNQELLAYEKSKIPYVELYDPYLAFKCYDPAFLLEVFTELLRNINNISIVLGSFYGTPRQENLEAIAETKISGFSLDLVTQPESIAWLASIKPVVIQIGILDARTTADDDLSKARELVLKVRQLYPEAELWLAPNNNLEFLPRQKAMEKICRLKEIV